MKFMFKYNIQFIVIIDKNITYILCILIKIKSPTPVGPSPIKPDLENNQLNIPFHQFDLNLKAAPLHHRPQTKTYAHLQL